MPKARMTVSTIANNNMTNLRRLFTLVLGLLALSPMRISAPSAAPSTPVESTSTSTYRVVPAIGPKLNIDEGWSKQKFPAHAMCYQSPERIAEVYSRTPRVRRAVVSAEKPADGSLRIVGTGTATRFRHTTHFRSSLEKVYREIAWKAVLNNPRSGVKDANQNGIADDRE